MNHLWGRKESCDNDDGFTDTPNIKIPTSSTATGFFAIKFGLAVAVAPINGLFPLKEESIVCPDTGGNGAMYLNYMDYYTHSTFFTKQQKQGMLNGIE